MREKIIGCHGPVSVFLRPEGKEGMYGVNHLVQAIGVGVQELRVTIDADHGHATEKASH